jgi:hypothetical protein
MSNETIRLQFIFYPAKDNKELLGGSIPKSSDELCLLSVSEDTNLDPNSLRKLVRPYISKDEALVEKLKAGTYKVACTIITKRDGVVIHTNTDILY